MDDIVTRNCIKCGKEATHFTGHVHNETVVLTAGWCEECIEKFRNNFTYPDAISDCVHLGMGCFGYYKKEYGFQIE